MVELSPSTPLSIEPLSARAIFARWCAAQPDLPVPPVAVNLPATGISHSTLGTFAWIDTAFAQALSTQQFISAIRSGDIPPCLTHSCKHPINAKLYHTSAARLAEKRVTLLDALGLTALLADVAFQSTLLECPICLGVSERYPTPQQVLNALIGRVSGQANLFAEGPVETLLDWARTHGLSRESHSCWETPHGEARARVQIDSLEIARGVSSRLSSLTHSLWRLRNPSIICVQDYLTTTFYKHGYCAGCEHLFSQESHADIARTFRSPTIITRAEELISCRVLPHGKSVRATLGATLDDLSALAPLTASHTFSLAMKTGLRDKIVGTATDELCALGLATLSICRSLGDALTANGTCIIDIPTALLAKPSTNDLSTILSDASSRVGIVMLSSRNEPSSSLWRDASPTSSGELIGSLHIKSTSRREEVHEVRRGHDVVITTAPFRAVVDALEATASAGAPASFTPAIKSELFSLPIFISARRTKSLLLHRLGLAESLANLFSSSVDARAAGLTPKNFTLLTTNNSRQHVCARCEGIGLALTYLDELARPLAQVCNVCGGGRFVGKVRTASWRGLSLSTLLNIPVREALPLLRALPRASELVRLLEALDLTHLPLGMPVTLMNEAEQHALIWTQAFLAASITKPSIVLVEAPITTLSAKQSDGLQELLRNSPQARNLAVVVAS